MNVDALLPRLCEQLSAFVTESPGNYITEDKALESGLAGLRLFDAPIVGVGAATDELFCQLRAPEAVGPQVRMPCDWLPGAQSVISYFLPISERVRASNRTEGHASPEWFHARIDGQAFMLEIGAYVVRLLEEAGFAAICPAAQPEMEITYLNADDPAHSFFSNWSERHVAYICGLGTFSLTKGLITEHGMAGRFGSVVTSAPLPATQRAYTGIYDYCIECGACIARCPVGAISLEAGKDHYLCYDEMMASKQFYPGYLGCGKCQTGVPCEFQRPRK